MKHQSCSIVLLLAALTSCAANNYSFPARDGAAPDVAAMEKARLALPADDETRSLGDAGWYPLISLTGQIYEVTDEPGFPAGTTFTDVAAYGPLFCVAEGEICRYDANLELYERERESSTIWGLYQSKRSDVLTPFGWRVRSQTKLLFGLLSWPSDAYTSRSPFESESPQPLAKSAPLSRS